MPFKFQKQKKIKNKADFQFVYNQKTKISQKFLIATYKKNNFSYPRLGVTVSKRVSKLAVTRNKIKRIVREQFRLNQARLPKIDIVIIMRPEAVKLSKNALQEQINKLWKKLSEV